MVLRTPSFAYPPRYFVAFMQGTPAPSAIDQVSTFLTPGDPGEELPPNIVNALAWLPEH